MSKSELNRNICTSHLRPVSAAVVADTGQFKNSIACSLEDAMIRKIGLLNHMGFGNLGDDATQVAVIKNIKSRWPSAEIILFSMNPADTSSRHGVPAYPIRTEFCNRSERHVNEGLAVKAKVKNFLRKYQVLFQCLRAIKTTIVRKPRIVFNEVLFLCKSFRIVLSLDLFIVSGGGQLLDSWGGPWKFPYTVFKWTLLAKLSRIQCYFLNVGAGPLVNPLAQWFVRSALALGDYVSFRDGDSRELVQGIGFAGTSQVVADCVYVLDPSPPPARGVTALQENPVVGLSPMAYCDPRVYWQKDQAVYDRVIRNVSSFGEWLVRNHYRLSLFSTDIWFDLQTIEDVKALLAGATDGMQAHLVRQEQIAGVNELLSQMHSMDYIVTCRFHGVVFAHLLNKPVIALSHHPKVTTLMNDLGLARYCLDIRELDVNALHETFQSLVADQIEIKSRMADKLACYKRSVTIQLDQLFPRRIPTVSISGCADEYQQRATC